MDSCVLKEIETEKGKSPAFKKKLNHSLGLLCLLEVLVRASAKFKRPFSKANDAHIFPQSEVRFY